MNNIGRIQLFCDVPQITYKNVIDVVRKAFSQYQTNVFDINYLLDFDAGIQPIQRKNPKRYRPDIDAEVIDNVAHEVVEFKLGFDWGNPITLVQRGEKDSGIESETTAISLLNECYEAEDNKSNTQKLARFIEICGIGYTYIETKKKDEWEDGKSYFSLSVLDPRCAFVVYSSYYIDQRPMLGVTFRHDGETGNNYFTCFSKDSRFEIVNLQEVINGEIIEEDKQWQHQSRSGELNPLWKIPVIEWIRSWDRTGAFEHQISECNNLNLMLSDFTNDVEQNTQALFHGNDVDFPKDEDGNPIKPKNGDWMLTYTTPDGKTPFINPLAIQYDYPGMLSNIAQARSRILQKCHVPRQAENVLNSTGLATDSATGWSAAENSAAKKQNIIEGCKMKEVEVVMAAIKNSLAIEPDNPLLKLRRMDIQPSMKRQRNYELSVKTTAFSNMVSHGIHGLHALKVVNLFEDVSQTWEDSRELIELYQNSLFNKQETKEDDIQTTDGGKEAQVQNSPLIDGLSKEKPEEADV